MRKLIPYFGLLLATSAALVSAFLFNVDAAGHGEAGPSGSAGGVTSDTLTSGTIPKASGAGALTNSVLTQSGTVVSTAGSQAINGAADVVQFTVNGNATQTYTNCPIVLKNSAGNSFVQVGYNLNGAANYGGVIWLGNAAPNAGNTNYALLGDGTDMNVNAPSGLLKLGVANSAAWQITSTGLLRYGGTTGFYSPVDGVFTIYRGDGTTTAWMQNSAGRARRAATQTVTDTTTLAADDTLSITVLAGRKYSGRLCYYFTTTVNSSGAKVDLAGGTATFTSFEGAGKIYSTSAGTFLGIVRMSAANTAVGFTATGTTAYIEIDFAFVCNAAGTFKPQFAQNAETGAAESVVAGVNSSLVMEDMP